MHSRISAHTLELSTIRSHYRFSRREMVLGSQPHQSKRFQLVVFVAAISMNIGNERETEHVQRRVKNEEEKRLSFRRSEERCIVFLCARGGEDDLWLLTV